MPELYIVNAIGDPDVVKEHLLIFNEADEAYVVEKCKINGKFSQMLNLRQFPFDTQV